MDNIHTNTMSLLKRRISNYNRFSWITICLRNLWKWCFYRQSEIMTMIPFVYILLFLNLYNKPFFFPPLNFSYSNANASIKLVTDIYVWSQMNTNIWLWSKTRVQCKNVKVGRYTSTREERFTRVHVDPYYLVKDMPIC